jgi:tetratricopeptide (TPR) repeat protein
MVTSRLILLLGVGALMAGCASTPALQPPLARGAPPALPEGVDPDASAYGLFLAGEAARDEGRLNVAAAYLSRAAASAGEPPYLKAQAFNAALAAGDVEAAAAIAPDATTADPIERQLGVLVRGVETLAEGKDKEAYSALADASLSYPFKTVADLIEPFAAAGAGDQAHALARPDTGGDGVAQFVADLDQAELMERAGRRDEAEQLFKTLLQNGDQSGLITTAYGGFLERRGRFEDAQALYRGRLANAPDDANAKTALARAQKHGRAPPLPSLRESAAEAVLAPAAYMIAQKQEAVALDELRLALRLDPQNAEAWLLVGDILAPADPDAGRLAYGHVPPGDDRYVAAQDKIAWSYQNNDDRDDALKVARAVLVAEPASREASATLADLLRADEQYAESAEVLTRLIEAPGAKPDWRLYYLRASAYESMGDAGRTEADLQAALKLAPDEPELLNFQGYFWIDRGERLKEALGMVQRAVDAEPQSGEILDSLGWAYYRLGDYKTAVDKLEQAITLQPGIPEVNDHLGDAYWRVGRKTEAEYQWRRVLTLAPDAKLKARVEAKLASPTLGPDAPPPPPALPVAPSPPQPSAKPS